MVRVRNLGDIGTECDETKLTKLCRYVGLC